MSSNALFQNSFYIGNNINGIFYGVELVLYSVTLWIIFTSKQKHTRTDKFFIFFSTALLVLITIYVAVQSVFGEEMWIVNANYSGGSEAYLAAYASVWYQTMGSAASVVLSLLSDGLLIYRCFIVWNNWHVVVIPSILYLASGALGITLCYVSGSQSANFFTGLASQLGVAYSATVIGLNFTVSSLIIGRILFVAKRLQATLGREVSQTYTGAASIIVESALPYTLFGIAYVVSLGIDSGISILFLSFYAMFTCISPQMIILRVLMRRGWTRDRSALGTSSFPINTRPTGIQEQYSYGSEGTAINLRSLGKSNASSSDLDKV